MSKSSRVDSLRPLPPSPSMNEEAVATYESEFKQYATKWPEILDRNAERMKRGSYSLHWMNTERPRGAGAPSRRRADSLIPISTTCPVTA